MVSSIDWLIDWSFRELRRQRGQKKARADPDVRKLGSYVLIKKVLPDGRYRDREDSLSDLASTFSSSFVPRRRSAPENHLKEKRERETH